VSEAALQKTGEGQFKLTGEMGFKTANALLKSSRVQFAGQQTVRVDMADVHHTDSAGLALMIEWTRLALVAGQDLKFTSVPAQLLSLAEISDAKELLPLA
jgi:phospholipid transport system transporter-binding protein